MSRIQRAAVAGLACVALLLPGRATAEVHAVEITLFMPCNQETADLAIAALEEVAGVEQVLASVGDLRVRILTAPDFEADPLSLVQVLWDKKIFPNRIYLEASGVLTADARYLQVSVETGFAVAPGNRPADALARHVWVRAEVLDWIEDRTPAPGESYTLHLDSIAIQDAP